MMRADQTTNRSPRGPAVAESAAQARAAQLLDPGALGSAGAGGTGDSALAPLRRQPSLTERVFRQLRDAIVKNELAPGTLVSIEQLAGLLGVSRTPIREALPALQQLGLIVQAENGGFRVAPLDREYAWEVYAVRSAIESLAAEIVATRLTDDDLSELRGIAVPHEPKPDGDYSEMFGPDLGLHDYIRQKCPLAFVNALIDSIRFHRARLLHLEHSLDAAYRKASYEEHCAIVDALERRDGKAARQLMQEHLDRVGAAVAAQVE